MSTNQKCFVCKNKIQPFDNLTMNRKQQQECKRFYSLVCRYLNIVDNGTTISSSTSRVPKKTLSPSESILQGDDPISCCDICIPLIKSFCDTYNNWKILQLVLNWKLETITKLMLMKSKINQPDELDHDPGLQTFRKRFLTIATDKSRDLPYLNIAKVKVPPSFQNDGVTSQDSFEEESSGVESPEISNFENDYVEDIHGPKLQDNLQKKSGLLVINSAAAAQPKEVRKTTPNSHHEDTAKVIYACRFCRKEFTFKCNCTRHEKTHSGVKPYKCRYNCGKSFFDNTKRTKHEIAIHKRNLAKYQCQYCAKKYVEKTALIGHERMHTGIKPYSCHYCEKSFSLLFTQKRHEHDVHGKKGTKRVRSNKKILKTVKQEFEVEQLNNNSTPAFQDDVGNENSDEFHSDSEAILVRIVKSEKE